MTVLLPAELAAQIRGHAAQAAPRECCGLLEGTHDAGMFRVLALHPAPNLADRADRFVIDPQSQFDALRKARARDSAIIGCYHSHPGAAAQPSATDLAGAGEENFLWLIAGDGALNAFVYLDGAFVGVATGADLVTSSL